MRQKGFKLYHCCTNYFAACQKTDIFGSPKTCLVYLVKCVLLGASVHNQSGGTHIFGTFHFWNGKHMLAMYQNILTDSKLKRRRARKNLVWATVPV